MGYKNTPPRRQCRKSFVFKEIEFLIKCLKVREAPAAGQGKLGAETISKKNKVKLRNVKSARKTR